MPERQQSLQQWLSEFFDPETFTITPASEDASFRSYHRVKLDERSFIVMDAPPQHEDCRPFIDITQRLLNCAVNAPHIHQQDLEHGFLLLSDFGDEQYLPNLTDSSADALYKAAIDSLVQFQVSATVEGLPVYNEVLLQREMSLFNDWLLKQYLGIELNQEEQSALAEICHLLIVNAVQQPQVFVHRDYHSRNLMITAKDNPGIIDYQDAVLGPITYDLVSLLKDSYISWSRPQRENWIDYYLAKLNGHDPGRQYQRSQFLRWFDLMGVQRELKVGGIFARLCLRDNKPGFVQDIPRTLLYIVDLKDDYPELHPLIHLIEERVLPALEQIS